MKSDHQPVAAKSAPLKGAVPKLELELDENATHVHRIPKELISRMREKESRARDTEDEEARDSLVGVSDDRTAVFRPPAELLARAKRMRPPAKPSVNDAPTKPPPPGVEAELEAASVPAAPKLPFIASTPPVAKLSSAPPVAQASAAPASRPVPAPPAISPTRVVPVAPVVSAPTAALMPELFVEPPERDSQVARDIEAGWDDEAVTGEQAPREEEAPARFEGSGSLFDVDEPGSGVMAVGGAALPVLAPPELETTGDFERESSPPTTTAPVVRTDDSLAPEAGGSPLGRNIFLFVLGVVAIALIALWKSRHY